MKQTVSIPEAYAEAVQRSDTCGFARLLGMAVTEIEGGRVRVAMLAEGMKNAHGTTHGGAIFALADHAFGIAANMEGVDQIAISANIRYFSVPAGETLEAVAYMVSETERTSVYAVDVYSGDRPVASFEGVGFKFGVPAQKE
ncbi:Acyl-coenzyme A thioesterase PaaI [Methanoculleus chikugoensis]|jgi:acyl-CoA thioesterase|uniref:Acyl-coenzyme A thioesterase PaaI n=1 Tax=Methanoculleus chikugoensis TaxID=118126 RepID=A0A1M4MP39_9EURY|nr:PaaI family thioesterase [Methanoculleus chikugoensis]NMA10117.1 PaaI family thioesterase [Methanomicrobiales archaeon]SCL76617.1 Acyl-coenzyme A thioesterase PaaI [Methanoculleus chikugoensis]